MRFLENFSVGPYLFHISRLQRSLQGLRLAEEVIARALNMHVDPSIASLDLRRLVIRQPVGEC